MLQMVQVRQRFPRPRVADVGEAVAAQMQSIGLAGTLRPGARVAIPVGSRGIDQIAAILHAVVRTLQTWGAAPFLCAAMGSHGGGTIEGQRQILTHLGITPEAVGAPLYVTDQAVSLGRTESGDEAWCDAVAAQADAIFLVNRVKPHTSFRAPLQSGLCKMLAVGLGKVPGATQVHRRGAPAIGAIIRAIARLMWQQLPVIGGLAVIENGYNETARIVGLRPAEMEQREEELLQEATALLPRLPVLDLHLLIVDEMGKNYSGTGMDTNVIGRWRVPGLAEPDLPSIQRLIVRRLAPASGGNANGIGLADFTTRQLVAQIDWEATYLNVLTTTFLERAKLPITAPNDRIALEWAVTSLQLPPGQTVRAARIANTLALDEVWLTPELLGEAPVEAVTVPQPLSFSPEGDLV